MKPTLKTDPNIPQPDDFYEFLTETYRDLSDQQIQMVNAKLILLLSNHLGTLEILKEAMRIARSDVSDV
jgi:hypothetical protein